MGKITKLKLKDFKSFRNAIIPFVGGFTTVVGPNGSGKSNILDAITFVLGTSSMKSLRAGRLTDLVHHKSSSGMAEVSIELAHGDEKHEIVRMIDKEGISVFKLNKKRTTLSEILEFLASMNISQDSRNIILQGEVSEVISMTPSQRREIIDGVSGIAEYNEKKDKALRELERVEERIKEANIILYERSGYLNELKKERNQAMRYKEYAKRREFLEHAVIAKQLEQVEGRLDTTVKELMDISKAKDELEQEIKKVSAQIANWENQLKTLAKEIQEKGGEQQLEISKKIERMKNQISLAEEKRKKEKTKKCTEKLCEIEEELSKSKISAKKLEKEKKAYEERLKKEEASFDEFVKGIKVQESTEELEDISKKLEEKRKRFYELKNLVDQLRDKISQRELSISEEEKEKRTNAERVKDEKTKLEKLKQGLARKKQLEERLKELKELESATEKRKKELEEQLEKATKEFNALETRLSTLEQLSGNKASNAVVSAGKAGELKGIIGQVRDIFSFAPENAGIISAVAGEKLGFIVTEDMASALKAVRWLKSKKLGRTSFIPLDTIRIETKKDRRPDGKLENVLDIVEFDERFKPVAYYVFGNNLVTRELNSDNILERGLVSLDGDFIDDSGVLTGGYEHGIDIAGETARMKELEERISRLNHELSKVKNMGLDEEMEKISKEIVGIELEVREDEIIVRELKLRLDELESMERGKTTKLSEIRKELSSLKAALIEKEKQLHEEKTELSTLEKQKELLQKREDTPEAKRVSERLNKQQKIIKVIREQLSEIQLQINQATIETENLEKRKKELEGQRGSTNLEDIEKEIKKYDEEIQAISAKLEKAYEEEKSISIATGELVEKRENLEARLRELAEQRGELRRRLDSKVEELNRMNIEKAKLETEYSSLKQRLGDVAAEELKQMKEEPGDIESLMREAEDLIQKMTRMEPVNLKAIQDYDEFIKEVDEIKEKSIRLGKEKEAVINLMEEIENKRKETFLEAFEKINEKFNEVYKEFYLGHNDARAAIKLENLEDPFQGGLLLEAQPAGKEIKNIDEMSTGEKTLAAIAFLFALQAFKPAPFYILDESDAALDKANSERLAEMIKKKSKEVQFIVATHNNSLIHASDQIVGVSMDKEKSSSIVEVDLKGLVEKETNQTAQTQN